MIVASVLSAPRSLTGWTVGAFNGHLVLLICAINRVLPQESTPNV